MITRHYGTLFARGNPISLMVFRSELRPEDLGAWQSKYSRTFVNPHGGRPYVMISFRLPLQPDLNVFDALATGWPRLQLVLLYRAFGALPANAFAVYEDGRRRSYGGTLVEAGQEDRRDPLTYPSQKLFGQHILDPAVIDSRLGIVDIDRDDKGQTEAENW